ncbi:hypothetical protein AGR1B_Cc120610 [Agrobacterium fabacearum S56]|nr:hypothetical protein AGR1C_Cc10263 [Agrobacterium fabacearum TT111]CUW90569.1 hypothetical protein AGR1B_Cc120610 [Agrobacterium fabacearum S56]
MFTRYTHTHGKFPFCSDLRVPAYVKPRAHPSVSKAFKSPHSNFTPMDGGDESVTNDLAYVCGGLLALAVARVNGAAGKP